MLSGIRTMFQKRTLSSYDATLPREQLIQAGRLVMVDDETPPLLEELRKVGFSVDHDKTADDLRHFDGQLYDVAIIDYHGVGRNLGTAQGLELIKYIRRVSPRTRIIAYTSRSLSAAESEFYRLSHAVLPKDLGLGESLAIIEAQLQKALSKEHLFEALLEKLAVSDPHERTRIERALVKAIRVRRESKFRDFVESMSGKVAEAAVTIIISKIFTGGM